MYQVKLSKLKKIRERLSLTPEDLAQKAKVPADLIRKIEEGTDEKIYFDDVCRLAASLRKPIWELVMQ
jgi:predicted transcriptional regulator